MEFAGCLQLGYASPERAQMTFVQVKPIFSATARPRQPQHWSGLVRNFGNVCWVFAGIIFVMAALLAYGQYRKMSNWIPAKGTLVQREIYWDYSRNTKGGNSIVYGARFTFRYSLDGQEKLGSADLGFRSGFRTWVEHMLESLPVGTQREIRVNPGNSFDLSLASDFGPLSFAAAYFAGALALLTFGLGLGCKWFAAVSREAYERRQYSAVS